MSDVGEPRATAAPTRTTGGIFDCRKPANNAVMAAARRDELGKISVASGNMWVFPGFDGVVGVVWPMMWEIETSR